MITLHSGMYLVAPAIVIVGIRRNSKNQAHKLTNFINIGHI